MKKFFIIITMFLCFLTLTGFTGGELTALQALLEKGGFVPSFLAVVWGTLLLLKRYPINLSFSLQVSPETQQTFVRIAEACEKILPDFIKATQNTPPAYASVAQNVPPQPPQVPFNAQPNQQAPRRDPNPTVILENGKERIPNKDYPEPPTA